MSKIKAQYFMKKKDNAVSCQLCPHNCHIKDGNNGICRVRSNLDGELYAKSYAQISSIALDPIEKKPLYRFHPGSKILSVGSFGCNFSCSFCQNHSIALEDPETAYVSPESLVYKAHSLKSSGNIGLAYTYNEPFISFEYVLDCCKLNNDNGLKNVLITNGYVQEKPLMDLLPYIDAMNIDLKSFSSDFYEKFCGGRIDPVKKTIELSAKECHVEITCLIIPELNDSPEEIEAMAMWISELSPEIPLHLTRFFPRHKLVDNNPTPLTTLETLAKIAAKHLKYVYLGNI